MSKDSKLQWLIANSMRKTLQQSYLASTISFIVIFLKPRTEKFFRKSSGQSMGESLWKGLAFVKQLLLNLAVLA